MSDSITIIGIAASVVPIVDVTGRLIARSCEIYQGAESAFRENHELEGIITDLQITNVKVANITPHLEKTIDLIRMIAEYDSYVWAVMKSPVSCWGLSLLKIGQDDKELGKLESVRYEWRL